MHKKTMCPAQRREKQQDSCPSQTKQQAEKQPTVTVGMHKKPGVQRTRNRETAAGAEPTTQAEKLCNVTFAIHKNNGSSPAQGNRSRIRAQAKQNSSQKNWLPSPLECIKNTGIQRAKQETAAGAEPKATKPQPEKPSNLTFGMHKKFMCPAYAEQGNSSGIHAQGRQNRSHKNPLTSFLVECIKNRCVQCMRNSGTSAGLVPKAYKTAARKTFNITFGMHENLMCPVHAKQGNSRRIRAQGRQNRRQKNPPTSLLECIENWCVQSRRNCGTSAGLVPMAYKTAARKTFNITFGMHEKLMCPVHAKQGNSRRIRAQGRQNRRQKNPLTSLLECIKNWCVQCMRSRGIVAGFVPKADKTAARKTLYHHLWNAYE